MPISRRQFIGSIAAGVTAVRFPSWDENLQDNRRDIKITAIETIPVKVPEEVGAGQLWMFVKLVTNKKDLAGYGEVYTLGVPFAADVLTRMIKDWGGNIALGQIHIESKHSGSVDTNMGTPIILT
jgi:hypothetical protein